MSVMPTNDSLPLTQGEWNRVLQGDPVRAGGLEQPDSGVQPATPTGHERREPTTSVDHLDTAILDQVFADMV